MSKYDVDTKIAKIWNRMSQMADRIIVLENQVHELQHSNNRTEATLIELKGKIR